MKKILGTGYLPITHCSTITPWASAVVKKAVFKPEKYLSTIR
jgi:hypothetical protein